MTDPYKVLGVSSNATDEQVKAAYRELAKKYHPDNYANNPLADLAEEKMQEINQAYDTITAQRKTGQTEGPGGQYNRGGAAYAGYGSSQFSDIRRLINNGRSAEAQELLDGVTVASRDAEWHFLRGSIYYGKGWLEEAMQCFGKAHSMNPQNQEYAAAYNQMLWQRQTGNSAYGRNMTGQSGNVGGCSCCDVCAAMYCANCCLGGCDGGCC